MSDITISCRYRKLKKNAESIAFRHNLRENNYVNMLQNKAKKEQKEAWINPAKQKDNIYYTLNLNNNNQIEQIQPLHLQNQIDALKNSQELAIKEKYESFKTSNGKKKTLRKNTNLWHEFVVFFGSTKNRENTDSKGLNEQEIKEIESIKGEKEIEIFCKKLQERYGFCNFIITKHNDEKTPHFHIIANQINKDGTLLTFKGKTAKREISEFGTFLQDEIYCSFKDLGLQRGVKGSKSKHKNIQEMHEQAEAEAKLKAQIEAKRKEQIEQLKRERAEKLNAIEQEKQEFIQLNDTKLAQQQQQIQANDTKIEQQQQQIQENDTKLAQQARKQIIISDKEIQVKIDNIWTRNTTQSIWGDKYDINKIKAGTLKLVKLGMNYEITSREWEEQRQQLEKKLKEQQQKNDDKNYRINETLRLLEIDEYDIEKEYKMKDAIMNLRKVKIDYDKLVNCYNMRLDEIRKQKRQIEQIEQNYKQLQLEYNNIVREKNELKKQLENMLKIGKNYNLEM